MLVDKNTTRVVSETVDFTSVMSEGGGTVGSKYSAWAY